MREINCWAKELQNLIKKMPKGIEVIIGNNSISIHKLGTLSKHLESPRNGWGINDDNELFRIDADTSRVIPYGEGS